MLGSSNTRSEQLEVIKSLIRKHNYKDSEKVYERCCEIGIGVNLGSLKRFTQKLELLDRTERIKKLKRVNNNNGSKAPIMSYEQAKQRETEITYALGELKLKENALLTELNSLNKWLESK